MIRFFLGYCAFIIAGSAAAFWWTKIFDGSAELVSIPTAIVLFVTSAAVLCSIEYISNAMDRFQNIRR